MAAGETTTGASPIGILEKVVLSIKDDDGFTLPMQRNGSFIAGIVSPLLSQ